MFSIEEFVVLKPKMYSILVRDSIEYEKEKGVNKKVVSKISYRECKSFLLNKEMFKTYNE